MFTAEELDAVIQGEAVPVELQGTSCVLVRKDIYDRMKGLLHDGVDVRGAYAATMRAWDQDLDPALPLYQKFRRQP